MPTRGFVHHIEIYVGDLERSISFWGWFLDRLGYGLYQEWDEGSSWMLGDTYLVFVQAPLAEGGFDRRHIGLNHLAFHAGDRAEVDALVEELLARGVELLYRERHPHAGGPDHYAAFFEDPDGLKVELVAP